MSVSLSWLLEKELKLPVITIVFPKTNESEIILFVSIVIPFSNSDYTVSLLLLSLKYSSI